MSGRAHKRFEVSCILVQRGCLGAGRCRSPQDPALATQLWPPWVSPVPSLPGLRSRSDFHGLPRAVFIA